MRIYPGGRIPGDGVMIEGCALVNNAGSFQLGAGGHAQLHGNPVTIGARQADQGAAAKAEH